MTMEKWLEEATMALLNKGFLHSGGSYTELLPPGWTQAAAYGINGNGEIIGYGNDGAMYKGFLYSGGTYTELLPPGWTQASANGINDLGEVVGYGNDGATYKGFLYSGGTYTELLPPGWTQASANDINDSWRSSWRRRQTALPAWAFSTVKGVTRKYCLPGGHRLRR